VSSAAPAPGNGGGRSPIWAAPGGWRVEIITIEAPPSRAGLRRSPVPYEGQQFRVKRHGFIAGYARTVAELATIIPDLNELTEETP
jgi:hypothetical protein